MPKHDLQLFEKDKNLPNHPFYSFFSSRRNSPGISYHIIYVPRSLHQVEVLLEEEGLYGKVTVHDYAWEIIPLDYDLLSLEFPSLFKQIFAQDDTSLLSCVPKCLIGIQSLYGSIGSRFAIGKNSVHILNQVINLNLQLKDLHNIVL